MPNGTSSRRGMEDAGEERVRHRHQRQHVELARHAVADPELGIGAGRLAPAAGRPNSDRPRRSGNHTAWPRTPRSWEGQGLLERLGARIRRRWCDQDGRRSANTAVASVATSPPPCDSSTHQCWLERLAFTSRTSRSNGPFRDRRAIIDGQRQRIAGPLRMLDQRAQDRRGGGAAERADEGPVIVAGLPCQRLSPAVTRVASSKRCGSW